MAEKRYFIRIPPVEVWQLKVVDGEAIMVGHSTKMVGAQYENADEGTLQAVELAMGEAVSGLVDAKWAAIPGAPPRTGG